MVVKNLKVAFIPIWVQFWRLPLKYLSSTVTDIMGSMVGDVLQVDYLDKGVRNIHFLRVSVWIDPKNPYIWVSESFIPKSSQQSMKFLGDCPKISFTNTVVLLGWNFRRLSCPSTIWRLRQLIAEKKPQFIFGVEHCFPWKKVLHKLRILVMTIM